MKTPIQVAGLRKGFVRQNELRPQTLKEAFVRRSYDLGKKGYFLALDHVNLEVSSGEIVGIIGRNGAGKSTLLRLIGGLGRPDEGSIQVHGKIRALLELGAGFHPELTGRENVFINGIVAGLTRDEVANCFEDIVNFAELQKSIDSPLRTYSSGMQLRLAFAVSVHTSPDVLLIDEVLAVGDIAFQQKCLERIDQFKREGCAILIVSHDMTQVKAVCDKVIWLRDGRVAASGDPHDIVGQYENAMMAETEKRGVANVPVQQTRSGKELHHNVNRKGTMEMEIIDVQLLDANGASICQLENGGALSVEIVYASHVKVQPPIFSVTISDKEGVICLDTNTDHLEMPHIDHDGIVRVHFDRLDLTAGEYFVDVGVYAIGWGHVYDYHWHVYALTVHDNAPHKGVLNPPHRWELFNRKLQQTKK